MNAGARQTLLLVDADPQSLRVLDVSLKKAGYDVLTAQGGAEALALLAEQPIDLVISDTHMPQMDGFELCRRIKERADWSRIPFIFLSSRKTIEDKIRGLEIGVEDYLIKPVYIKEITTRVRMLLQRRQRERLESRRDTRTRFAGELADIGIVDLLQTIEVNRKSGIIHINNSDGRRGAIYFRDGRVIDAEAGRLVGVEAVYRLFGWNEGGFEVEFKNIRRRDVVELSPQSLLMEGMRRLDEWTRLLETLPSLETVSEVDYFVLAEKLADLPDEVNAILRLLDGRRSLLQVIEDSDFSDVEALSVIARLYADNIVYEAQGVRPPQTEARQTRLGRLERWLSESPWDAAATQADGVPLAQDDANAEAAALADDNHDAPLAAARATLPGFVAPDPPPAPATRDGATTPGMATADEGLVDLQHAALGRTLPGFEPLHVDGDGFAHDATTVTVPAIIDDPDRTPAPAFGAQPVEEMQAAEEPGPAGDSMPEGAAPGSADGAKPASPAPVRPDDLTPLITRAPSFASDDQESEPLAVSARNGGTVLLEPDNARNFSLPFAAEGPAAGARRSGSARRDDLDDELTAELPTTRRRGVIMFSAALAVGVVAGWLFFRHRGDAPPPAVAPAAVPETARATPTPGAAPEPAGAEQALPPVDLPKSKPPAEPTAANRASQSGDEPTAAAPRPVAAAPAPAPAAAPAPAPAVAGSVGETPQDPERVRAACRRAYDSEKYRAIVDACGKALQVRKDDAGVMVMLAHAELDRGHSSAALRWARKAVAADPKQADAYVFIGEIEQEVGNVAAAKAAYGKYLDLAPNGRYASDLRAILRNM